MASTTVLVRHASAMDGMRCTFCGHVGLGDGYVAVGGMVVGGFAVWVSGLLRRNGIGAAKGAAGRPTFIVDVFRCPACGHLEMFANRPT
jgi:DNA-directed RNA polymerase subunit RPC12/RpoP